MGEMIAAFVFWSVVCLIFVAIGIANWKSKTEVGFFTGVKPSKKKDITAYNHAVAKIWFFFAAGLEISGIPIFFIKQNSLMALIPCAMCVILCIAIMIIYVRVDAKYR